MISREFIYKFFGANEHRRGEQDISRHIHDNFAREMAFSPDMENKSPLRRQLKSGGVPGGVGAFCGFCGHYVCVAAKK